MARSVTSKNLPSLFGLSVSLGRVPELEEIRLKCVKGVNPDVDTGTVPEDVWGNGGLYVAPTAARIHAIVSSSTNDTSAGTGARTLEVFGLDTNYAEISETVTLNGTTPVNTVNSYRFIERLHVLTAGSGGQNAGVITATAATDSTISCTVQIGTNESALGVYQIPAGYTAYIFRWQAGMQQSSAGSDAEVWLRSAPEGEVFQTYGYHYLSNSGASLE